MSAVAGDSILPAFSLEAWLAEQDVSERDETLSDRQARLFFLHQRLSDSERVQESVALARRFLDSDAGLQLSCLVSISVDEPEPRFALLALVDILQLLRRDYNSSSSKGNDGEDGSRRSDGEDASRPSDGGDASRRKAFCRILAASAPDIVRALLSMAEVGDVCEDSMSCALALFSFLLGRHSGLSDAEREGLRLGAVGSPPWLKVAMRLWLDEAAAAHVAGRDEGDAEHGLGFLVTAFLQHVAGCAEEEEGGVVHGACAGRAALVVELGPWFLSFFLARLSAGSVCEDERARLVTVLWACCAEYPSFAKEHVWDDLALITAVAASAACLSKNALVPVVAPAAPDGPTVAAAADAAGDATAVCSGKVPAAVPSHDAGEQQVLEECSEEEEAEALRAARLLFATRAAGGVFSHFRLFQLALRDDDQGGPDAAAGSLRRQRFLRRYGLRMWFWDALRHAATLSYSLAGYEIALGAGCSKFIAAPCLRSSLSFVVWKVAEWLATDEVKWKTNPGGTVLTRREIWERLFPASSILCDATAVPLQAQCALNLAKLMLEEGRDTHQHHQSLGAADDDRLPRGAFCEWCFVPGCGKSVELKSCGGCGRTRYCGTDHMRFHWKSGHKLACAGGKADESSLLIGKAVYFDPTDADNGGGGGCAADDLAQCGGLVAQALLQVHGAKLAKQGLALRFGPAASKRGDAVHFGQLLSQATNISLVTAVLQTCRQGGNEFVPVAEHHSGEGAASPRLICLHRCGDSEDWTTACARLGCYGHDSSCMALT